MAKTAAVTADHEVTEQVYIGVPFLSKSKDADGNIIVHGKVTDDSLDLDKQIVDRDFARKALSAWATDWGNLRQMHATNLPPAGLAIELEEREDGFYLTGKVVEPTAKLLVENDVYKAFSVGVGAPRIVPDRVATKGRIVDGRVIEVSLVDHPANPNCRFDIVKMADAPTEFGDWEYVGEVNDEARKLAETTLNKAAKPDEDGDGDGDGDDTADEPGEQTPSDGDEKVSQKAAQVHPEVVADATAIMDDVARSFGERRVAQDFLVQKMALADEAKRDFSDDKREQLADEGKALPDGSFPIETVGDLENAVSAYGRAKDKAKAKAHIIARAKALDAEDKLPDDWKGGGSADKIAEPSFALKRLHDALCPCYDLEQVEQTYPAIAKNGVASTLGPQTVSALYEMLLSEVSEDAGTGKSACDIGNIAKAYDHLVRFVSSELFEAAYAGEVGAGVLDAVSPVLREARADLHKAFRKLNDLTPGDIIPIEGPIQPGRFRRPRLDDGRYRENAGASARIPDPSPIDAQRFDRDGQVAGEERESPGNKGDLGAELWKAPSGRVFYTNAFREEARSTMQQVHDHIAATFPDLCAGHADVALVEDQIASTVKTLDSRDDAKPTAPPELPDVGAVKELIAEHVTVATGALEKQITDLQAEVERLSAAPDPNRTPVRLSGLLSAERSEREAAEKAASGDGDDKVEKRAAGVIDGGSFVAYLRRSASSGDPRTRESALRALDELGVGQA